MVMLETSAIWWVAGGYALLVVALADGRRRLALDDAVAVGMLFGFGLLTKDMIAFLTLLPLAACLVFDWAMPRRRAVLIGAITLITYLPYPILVLVTGNGPAFVNQKFRGLLRLIGLVKETGFNRHSSSSFLQSVINRLDSGSVPVMAQ